ncbi:MAG TPA: hypothetical protein VJQ80_06870, partial [Arthrobacter sp.]|nr:hypothetical protein [Arthrobacter sp.]
VARQAAAMVLRDDSFATIVAAIREGRVIFANIRRFVLYLLACNLSEVMVVTIAVAAGLPLPLLPLHPSRPCPARPSPRPPNGAGWKVTATST